MDRELGLLAGRQDAREPNQPGAKLHRLETVEQIAAVVAPMALPIGLGEGDRRARFAITNGRRHDQDAAARYRHSRHLRQRCGIVPDVLEQMEGLNLGFVRNFARHYSQCKPAAWAEVMKYYGLGSLPVLHQLAANFAICDHWFSSVPGPTWPNRFFVHSGTSLGHVDMPDGIFHPNLHL